jgi:hypothetical protein
LLLLLLLLLLALLFLVLRARQVDRDDAPGAARDARPRASWYLLLVGGGWRGREAATVAAAAVAAAVASAARRRAALPSRDGASRALHQVSEGFDCEGVAGGAVVVLC